MRYFALALLILLAHARGICQANTGCPWLNVATASGVLKSNESGPMATLAEGSSAACRFDYHDATASRALKITVEDAKEPGQAMEAYKVQCGAGTAALRAIGNEACAAEIKGESYGAEVIGRVRNQIFTVTITTAVEHDPFMPKEALREKTRSIAEQVAGALF